MAQNPHQISIYHITDVANLAGILADGGLNSDAVMAARNPIVIGYSHIKERRLTQIRVPCCGGRFVGEFVPFYFCPRSPMLFTINMGNTGRPAGSQASIVHLVSSTTVGWGLGQPWAVSDGNAGAFHANFYDNQVAIAGLDWNAINATDWKGRTHQKMAEFLVADFFPWTGFTHIGCHSGPVAAQVNQILQNHAHQPTVSIEPAWYY